MDLEAKIRTLPTGPGVYLYKDAEGTVIYVGKAKNLRSRVRSYLLAASQAHAKTGSLMREAVDLDYILVDNEHEALALENNLIKQKKPRFNILLRDDKTYPYVKLTMADRYPKVFVTCARMALRIMAPTSLATWPTASLNCCTAHFFSRPAR
jgi:excinuclease ABC subunit C